MFVQSFSKLKMIVKMMERCVCSFPSWCFFYFLFCCILHYLISCVFSCSVRDVKRSRDSMWTSKRCREIPYAWNILTEINNNPKFNRPCPNNYLHLLQAYPNLCWRTKGYCFCSWNFCLWSHSSNLCLCH